MDYVNMLSAGIAENWPVWIVTFFLILAAVIDGFELKVPNWLTFSMILSGWAYSGLAMGWSGLGWSLFGTVVGLILLLPAYSVGGMGAGDVKLLAGVGAWVWGTHTFFAFCVSTIVGAVLAVLMVVLQKSWTKHKNQFWMILAEFMTIRDPNKLAEIAANRKSSMMLLPYGIPIAIGTIGYFAWQEMLV